MRWRHSWTALLHHVLTSVTVSLAGTPALSINKLQRVLNAAAKVIYGGRKFDHVTLLLRDKLHWLKIPERIKLYKLYLLIYKRLSMGWLHSIWRISASHSPKLLRDDRWGRQQLDTCWFYEHAQSLANKGFPSRVHVRGTVCRLQSSKPMDSRRLWDC